MNPILIIVFAPLLAAIVAGLGNRLLGNLVAKSLTTGALFVSMIGAIVLTHRERKDTRPQSVARQIARRPQDAARNTRPEVGRGIKL